jgi:AcrR family transcriptional regulator
VDVKESADNKSPVTSLRERKKIKTRIAVQKQAMRLFRKQGYEATTVEQIAAAAEISPSTFFRYFPSKEDLIMYDPLDEKIIEIIRAQPLNLGIIPAVRATVHQAFENLSEEEITEMQEKEKIMRAVPELRSRSIDEIIKSLDSFSKVLAERLGRSADDLMVRTIVGAIMGVIMSIYFVAAENNFHNFLKLMDTALEQLETGLKL